MPRRAVSALGVLVAALVLASCASSVPGVARPDDGWLSGSGARGAAPAAWSPLEFGRALLWLPKSWTIVDAATAGCGHLATRCSPCAGNVAGNGDDVLYLSVPVPARGCTAASGRTSAWLVTTAGRGVAQHRVLRGGGIEVAVPGARAIAYGFGGTGVRVAESLRPSSLAVLLDHAAHLPAAPATWRRVTAGAVSLAVPASWPATRLNPHRFPPLPLNNPCGLNAAFPRPWLLIGTAAPEVEGCPLITWPAWFRARATPGDGVWVTPVNPRSIRVQAGRAFRYPGSDVRELVVHGMPVFLTFTAGTKGASELEAMVSAPHGQVQITLGLGRSAAAAERILGSLRPASPSL